MTTNNATATINPTPPAEPIKETYLCLKTASANKLGQRATGQIHYQLLTDVEKRQVYLRITQNDGGGYHSRECVPFDKVQAAVSSLNTDMPFPSKVFKDCFHGQSQNNSGFLACILRAEGLLVSIPDKVHLHRCDGDWTAWAASLLEQPGEPVEIVVGKGTSSAEITLAVPADTPLAEPMTSRKERGRKAKASEMSQDAHAE